MSDRRQLLLLMQSDLGPSVFLLQIATTFWTQTRHFPSLSLGTIVDLLLSYVQLATSNNKTFLLDKSQSGTQDRKLSLADKQAQF